MSVSIIAKAVSDIIGTVIYPNCMKDLTRHETPPEAEQKLEDEVIWIK